MRYISLFSGIECASVAARPLGWEAVCFAEIEPFPSAVLTHHYPDVPNVGDMTAHDWRQYRGRCDVVIGGSPCQAFSVAGRRESLADARGNLTLSFVEAVNAIDPVVVVWENVPGVLNTRDNAFGCFLAALAGHDSPLDAPDGRAWGNAGVVIGSRRALAWRILDAQYFGVPQRRRRVFLVGCPRSSGLDPAAILFEAKGGCGDFAPRGEAAENVTGTIEASIGRSRGAGISPGVIVGAVSAKWAKGTGGPAGDECQNLVVGTPLPTYAISTAHTQANGRGIAEEVAYTLERAQRQAVSVALRGREGGNIAELGDDISNALCSADGGSSRAHVLQHEVRRLTPRECERLQGLPDDYTLVPWLGRMAADGPRYKAIGNGMAVPCVRWIFERIQLARAEGRE